MFMVNEEHKIFGSIQALLAGRQGKSFRLGIISWTVIFFCYPILATVSWADLNDGLVGYWNMDDADIDWSTNTIQDRSGNGNTGSLTGFSSTSVGRYNQGLTFIGPGTSISVAGAGSLDLRLNNTYTYSIWVFPISLPSDLATFFYKSDNQEFAIDNAGRLLLRSGGSVTSQLFDYDSASVIKPGNWYHLAGVYDGNMEYIYINGALIGKGLSVAATGIVGRDDILRIGGATYSIAFNGTIDEARVYNRALSALEVKALYQSAKFDTTPFPAPPAAPAGLVSPAHTTSTASLSWTPNSESYWGSYNVYANNQLIAVVDKNQTTFQALALSQGTSYSFQLSAVSTTHMEGPKSSPLMVTTDGTTVPYYFSPLPLNYVAPKIRISSPIGRLTPDATGVYELQAGKVCSNLPVWKRTDGNFYVQYLNSSILYITDGNNFCNYNMKGWVWAYSIFDNPSSNVYPGYTGTAFMSKEPDPMYPTPGQYLLTRSHPVFKPGHTLPPLTRFGWGFSYELTEEMAHWGYALDLGDASASLVAEMAKPYSRTSRLLNLVANDPAQYKLCVNMDRIQDSLQPDAAYLHDVNGALVGPTPTSHVWSPEAPDSILTTMSSTTGANLQQIAAKAPISIILNGGERGVGVWGWDGHYWKLDPTVMAVKNQGAVPKSMFSGADTLVLNALLKKGVLAVDDVDSTKVFLVRNDDQPVARPAEISNGSTFDGIWNVLQQPHYLWSGYEAKKKAHQEEFFISAAHASANNPIYIFYTAGGNAHGYGGWDWDYRWMRTVSDLASNEDYSSSGNATLILGERSVSQGFDLLTYALNAVGYAATFGRTAFYNWVCAGWDLYPWSTHNTSLDRYQGFLKTLYVSGMVGANAGYYDFPQGLVAQSSFSSADTVNGAAVMTSLIDQGVLMINDPQHVKLKTRINIRPKEISSNAYDKIWYLLQLPSGFDAQFDKNQPPDWLNQIEVLSHVHAQFSYLEDMLCKRDMLTKQDICQGDLLPGEDGHSMHPERPAYEFRTGYKETRVLARKKHAQKRWLISAWAADGITRSVDVTIPGLGKVHVTARPTGSLYDARIVNKVVSLTLLDPDPVHTPLMVPASTPDADGSGDVSGNGAVTMYDAALTLRGGLTPAQQKEADINGDATIDVTDASAIARKALGLNEG
ncbi:MAG: hypothetical protein HQL22_00145 [Candidatus Omnitrophica bacterium]|nr:hypothetical protein [Candidatus Omnitrophota bacterium]